MTSINRIGRPWAVFDASNKEHREWFYQFLSTGSWAHCPIRFVGSDPKAELIACMQKDLLMYYGNTEFGKVKQPPKKPSRLRAEVPLTSFMEQT